MVIRQPRPVRVWEKELPAWVRNFEEDQAEEAKVGDYKGTGKNVESWDEIQRLSNPGAAWRLSP